MSPLTIARGKRIRTNVGSARRRIGVLGKVFILSTLAILTFSSVVATGLVIQIRSSNPTRTIDYTVSLASAAGGLAPFPLVWEHQLAGGMFPPLIGISDNASVIAAGGYPLDQFYVFGSNSSVPRWSQAGMAKELAASDDGAYVAAVLAKYALENSSFVETDMVACFQSSNGSILMNYTTSATVTSVDMSGDGKYIVAGGPDCNISLFIMGNATPTWTYPTQKTVSMVRISDDGSTIVAETYMGSTYLIDRATGTLIWKTDIAPAITPWPECTIGISGDGHYVAMTTFQTGTDKVYLLGRTSNTPLWNYTSPAGYQFSSIAISRDGNYVAAGNVAGDVYLFRKESNVPIWTYWIRPPEWYRGGGSLLGGYINTAYVMSVALSSNGSYVVASTEATEIYLFRSSSDVPLWIYSAGHGERVRYVAISADGGYVVAGGDGGWIYLLKAMDLTWMSIGSLAQSVAASVVVGIGAMLAATSTVIIHLRVNRRHSQSRVRR